MTLLQPRVSESEVQLGNDPTAIRHDFVEKLFFQQAKFPAVATTNDCFLALAYVVRDRLLHRWVRSARTYLERHSRTVVYLSAEYLMGPQLGTNLLALGIEPSVREAMAGLGLSLDTLVAHEEEPGLGNGGLGRLAACFMDSLATLEIPAIGHGIRYEFGIFDQEIREGQQVEKTDNWLRLGNPWEIRRHEIEHVVGFGGRTEHGADELGRYRARWVPERIVKGVPYDTPVLGFNTDNANFLRLWTAVAPEEFDLEAFNGGEYWRAVDEKIRSENITKVLYPNDQSAAGRQLRLEQQYFFVSCALQDLIRIQLQKGRVEDFAKKYAIQLNDTHPTLAVPELLRLLIDRHGMSWESAWEITRGSFSYTNHTLLPEALETWPLPLFERLLPRHVEIIYEINRRFLDEVRARFPGDEDRVRRMSIIDEEGDKRVRMAHLATVASSKVNGVAKLHSSLLIQTVLRDFAELWPDRFTNVTNGVTPRRFLALANPGLATLITEAIGNRWIEDLEHLRDLEPLAQDPAFRQRWREVKRDNKARLSSYLQDTHALDADPDSLFDAQCKRIHEYKRQHLAVLHAVYLHQRIRRGDLDGIVPRTLVFAGKAAPGYRTAKLIIRLIHGVAKEISKDPVARKLLRVVFAPDFNVKNAQRIYPAADLSEQISTAGKEASGTGNMKFSLNGALTIGTLDGANVEIREAVGPENFFLFGLTAEQVSEHRANGYDPRATAVSDGDLADALERIAGGAYSPHEKGLFAGFIRDLVERDEYMTLADFRSYVDCQHEVARAWIDPERWTRMAITNVARMGYFSSDRSIREYARDVWHVQPMPIHLPTGPDSALPPPLSSPPPRITGQ
jgi:starch phosphorylase